MSVLERTQPAQPPEALSDAVHVLEALGGDDRAFAQIVRLYEGRVLSFLFQLTKHRQDSEDLAQQTFIKAFEHLERFDRRRPLIHWLLAIARNNALNYFRALKPSEPLPETLAAAQLSSEGGAGQPDESANLWEQVRALLPMRQFEVLWLRYGEELSVRDTAQVLGLTQTHVKILVFRARHTLLKANLQL